MVRRLVVAALAAVCASTAVPAEAKAPVKLYLNQAGSCGSGPAWVITTIPDDSGGCVYVPREQVNGEGLPSENEAFATTKKTKAYTIDGTKALTGTFALFGSSGLTLAEGPAMVAADFTVKVAKKKVGVVHVEGLALPTMPVTQAFSLKLPSGLNRVKTNSVQVQVNWITCVGLCGVAVSGTSFLSLPVR